MSNSNNNSFICDNVINTQKCEHKEALEKNKNSHPYIFCFKCFNIVLIVGDKFYTTTKLNFDDEEEKTNSVEFDPVTAIKLMIKRQNEQYKILNEKFYSVNIDYYLKKEMSKVSEETNNEDEIEENKTNIPNLNFNSSTFELYAEQRNKLLVYLHKLCCKLKYSDNTFYLALYLLDIYLSHIYTKDITNKELFLTLLGFFLISSKYIEDDIFEPDFEMFCNFNKNITLTIKEIRISEMKCLAYINYNMYNYSTYDWLNIFLNNGILFDNEISNSRILGNLYIYTQKILTLITSKSFFVKYSSLQIALSIIRISRERFLINTQKFSQKLFAKYLKIFNIKYSDFEECYMTIKNDLKINENSTPKNLENEETNENHTTTNIINTINYKDSTNFYSNSRITINGDVKSNRMNLSKIKFKNTGENSNRNSNLTNIMNGNSFNGISFKKLRNKTGDNDRSNPNLDTSRRLIFNNISTIINCNYNSSTTNPNNLSANSSNIKTKIPVHFIINCNDDKPGLSEKNKKVKIFVNNENANNMNMTGGVKNHNNFVSSNKKMVEFQKNKISFMNNNDPEAIKLKNSLNSLNLNNNVNININKNDNSKKKNYNISCDTKNGIKQGDNRDKISNHLLLKTANDTNQNCIDKISTKNNKLLKLGSSKVIGGSLKVKYGTKDKKFLKTNGKLNRKIPMNFKENMQKNGFFLLVDNNNNGRSGKFNKYKSLNKYSNKKKDVNIEVIKTGGSRNNTGTIMGNQSTEKEDVKLNTDAKVNENIESNFKNHKIMINAMHLKSKLPKLKLNPFTINNK